MKKVVIFIMLVLLLTVIVSADIDITTPANVIIKPDGSNNITFSTNHSFDKIVIDTNDVNFTFNSTSFKFNSTGDLLLGSFCYLNNEASFNATMASGDMNATVNLSTPSATYYVYIDSSYDTSGTTDSGGFLSYLYNSWSLHSFLFNFDVPEFVPADPITLANSTYNFGVNFTFAAGSGNVADSFNISTNNGSGVVWNNGSSALFSNTSTSAHGYVDITIYAYNNSGDGTLSAGSLTDNVTVPNNIITISNVSSSYILNEGETLYIDANYADDDGDTGTFGDNSSDWNVDTSTGVVSWVTADGDDGTHDWYINVSDGYGGADTQAFTVTVNNTIGVVISLISVTPAALETNYTGTITISYMVESYDPLNLSSLAFLYGVNYTIDGDMHNYIKAPHNTLAFEGLYRTPGRNVTPYLSWEFNTTITENNVWKWGGYDNDSTEVSTSVINATHTYVNVTGTTEDILPSSFYIGRRAMYNAPKTGFEINRQQGLIFKMWNVEKTRGRDYNHFANFYFDTAWESTLPTYPVEIGYCNNSYNPAVDDIDTCAYCAKFGEWDGNRWVNHSFDPGANASYASPLTINASHFTDPSPDEVNYIWLRSYTTSSKSFILNATNHDPGITNITFAQTETFWTYNEQNGVTTAQAYTPSFFATFARDNEELLHHLYIADDTGEWGHSTIFNESIGVSQVPVPPASFEHFELICCEGIYEDTYMDATYNAGSLNVHMHFPADPDGGSVSQNITLHHADNLTYIAVVNNTLTTTGEECVDIDFSTTPHYSSSNLYKLRCVSTDEEGSTATTWLSSYFTLDGDGNTGWVMDDMLLFWGMNDIPTLYSTISNNSLISYNAGSDIYTMHVPFFKSKHNDTFRFNETVHLKSLNDTDIAYFRFLGDTIFNNANIHAWNTTSDTIAPDTDAYRGYLISYFLSFGNITNSNLSYLGSNVYRKEGLNFIDNDQEYLINNTILSHNAEGLIMEECSNYTISHSTMSDNLNVGVGVYFSTDVIVENNTIDSNDGRGVTVYEGDDNIIRYNEITNSGIHGIHLWSNSNNNTCTGNNITGSSTYDYYLTGTSTGNFITDPASTTDKIRSTSSCSVNIENTDNAAFSEDSVNNSYAYLTNFSMYVSGVTQTFDITQHDLIITPSTDEVNIWNLEWVGNLSFNASSDTADNPTWFNGTNISWADHNIGVYRNGTLYENETTDLSGLMVYNYTGGFSEKYFEFVLGSVINKYNFTFTNAAISPTAIRENEPFTVSVDINDSDGTISTAIVKINYNNYTMTQGVGDTWTYTFTGTSVATRYYVTDFYAQDNRSDWNSTTSALYIDAVSSTGTGSSGGISPAPTPTLTPTPTPEPTPEVPVNVTGVLENVTGIIERLSSENSISIFKLNFDKNPKIFTKEVYLKNTTSCEISEVSKVIETCDAEDGKVTISVMFLPEESPFIYTTRDHITLYTTDDKSYYINVDIIVLNFVSPLSLSVLSILIIISIGGVVYYWRRKNK